MVVACSSLKLPLTFTSLSWNPLQVKELQLLTFIYREKGLQTSLPRLFMTPIQVIIIYDGEENWNENETNP